jgi:hypothetical protein
MGFLGVVSDLLPKYAGFFGVRRGERVESARRMAISFDCACAPIAAHALAGSSRVAALPSCRRAPADRITPSHLDLHRVDI